MTDTIEVLPATAPVGAEVLGLDVSVDLSADQVADLLATFDWALTEDCFAEYCCDRLLPFVAAGKAVFSAEYTDTGTTTDRLCPRRRP